MQINIHNRLSEIRNSRGLAAAVLARNVGVSRQTIYAIEAGNYVPNTEVALKLARELEVSVEELFTLDSEKHDKPSPLSAEVLSATPQVNGQAVQLCKVGDRLVCTPQDAVPYYLHEADGVISKMGRSENLAEVAVFAKEDSYNQRLLVAGCDPAIGMLARMVERLSGVQVISAPASSRLALRWLKEGKVHIAGTHLKDSESGEFNLPILRREYPDEDLSVITFACWEEGFVTAAGNPKRIQTVADLARRGIKLMNREAGSGSRALLDSLLKQAGVTEKRLAGYNRIAHGHLAAAYAVSSGQADCCIAARSAAHAFGLGFVPIQTERYDLVMHRKMLDLTAVQTFIDVLQKAGLRRKLQVLAGYDTAKTGATLA
jgi:molybdate-binding protein/DNA-binding XRE family transcriptional regulator